MSKMGVVVFFTFRGIPQTAPANWGKVRGAGGGGVEQPDFIRYLVLQQKFEPVTS
jgi:hypothetical protein